MGVLSRLLATIKDMSKDKPRNWSASERRATMRRGTGSAALPLHHFLQSVWDINGAEGPGPGVLHGAVQTDHISSRSMEAWEAAFPRMSSSSQPLKASHSPATLPAASPLAQPTPRSAPSHAAERHTLLPWARTPTPECLIPPILAHPCKSG